jgi:hypothetical protein
MQLQEARSAVLEILSRLYVPTTGEDLSLCVEMNNGLRIPKEEITDLIRQDFEGFRNRQKRDCWVCPALSYPNGSANHNYLTRSDWLIRSRLVESTLSAAQELMLLRGLCDMVAVAVEKGDASRAFHGVMDRINELAVTRIPRPALVSMRARRTVPTSDVLLYREIAEDLYGPLVRAVRKSQRSVADEISALPLLERYFGGSAEGAESDPQSGRP